MLSISELWVFEKEKHFSIWQSLVILTNKRMFHNLLRRFESTFIDGFDDIFE